jgi:peptidoglycan glycosyltransferase
VNGPAEREAHQRWRRVAPIVGAAVVAFGAGALLGGNHVPASERTAEAYGAAWEDGDLARMYELTDAAERGRSLQEFARAYRDAEVTATVLHVGFGEPRDGGGGGVVELPARITTEAFGTVAAPLRLPIGEVDGEPRISWAPELVFPGLRPGEQLSATTELPPRAALLFRDRSPLARGSGDGVVTVSTVASSIAGSLGPIPADRAEALRAKGVPGDAQVGLSGLERIFDDELRGRPGGILRAGERQVGSQPPRAAAPVRTTISPEVQEAALSALAGRLGGIVAMRPRTGEVLAAAGIPISGLQPPGSTFKIITVTAGLEAGITKPSKTYPIETEATLEGVPLENANGESCGGTLVQSFAHSCNSVFAPMGAELGADRLVEAAHRFGFDEPIAIPGAATPTLPPASDIGDDLAVGSSAIGQGQVQATALSMTTVAATIALEGRRPRPTFAHGRRLGTVEVTTPEIADEVERMMEAVVTEGTGTAAAIPGMRVAGKTGTAELVDTRTAPGAEEPLPLGEIDVPDTDAWFVAYAPGGRRRPRVAVGVLLVQAGAGGAVAAPAARTVLEAALARR